MSQIPDRLIVPVAWIEESAEMDQKSKDQFDEMLLSKDRLLNNIAISLLAIGLVGFVGTIAFYGYKRKSF